MKNRNFTIFEILLPPMMTVFLDPTIEDVKMDSSRFLSRFKDMETRVHVHIYIYRKAICAALASWFFIKGLFRQWPQMRPDFISIGNILEFKQFHCQVDKSRFILNMCQLFLVRTVRETLVWFRVAYCSFAHINC